MVGYPKGVHNREVLHCYTPGPFWGVVYDLAFVVYCTRYRVVESMRRGLSPTEAAKDAIETIAQYYPDFSGALVAVNISGGYGAANHGFKNFKYTVYNPVLGHSTVITI